MISKLRDRLVNLFHKKALAHVDVLNDDLISGWAYNQAKPNEELVLDIYIDDYKIGSVNANIYREDLKRLKMGSGNHGFSFNIPTDIKLPDKGAIIIKSKNIEEPLTLLPSSIKSFSLTQKYRRFISFEELPIEVKEILESEIFCLDYYNTQFKYNYLDINSAALHYWTEGANQGKKPHYFFDSDLYLSNSPDVKANKFNPLHHYITSGWKEGRNPSSTFFADHYQAQYCPKNHENPLSHFIKSFVSGSLKNVPENLKVFVFDAKYYLEENPDVAALNLNPALHFFNFGYKENRNPNEIFNTLFYKQNNSDVGNSKINPYFHYLFFGKKEGRKVRKYINIKSLTAALTNETKPVKKLPVDIVLPIYNGYDFVADLLPTIKSNTLQAYNLIIINDCSPDERIKPLLKKFSAENKNIKLIENKENLGFVKSVNLGLKEAKNDVVILNSDTVLPKNWLPRLMYPIWSSAKIASVTPFTNAGTIASYPTSLKDNDIFLDLNIDEIDQVFNSLNPNNYVSCPTGVGFCMAMSKKAIQKVGILDDVSFDKGFGEENDWCRRAAKLDFENVITPNLFIWHKHGGSFTSEEKQKLTAKNTQNLVKKHPEYFGEVRKHISNDELDSIRFYAIIKHAQIKASSKPILYIDHRIGGGANAYLDKKLATDKQNNPVLLFSYNFKLKCPELSLHFQNFSISRYFENTQDLFDFLNIIEIKQIFYNNLVSFKSLNSILNNLVTLKKSNEIPISIAIHDFFPVCQSFTLVNQNGKYCGAETNPKVCEVCIKENKNYEDKSISITQWRSQWELLLENANEIICFSESSKNIINKVYANNKKVAKAIVVIRHTLPVAIPNKPVLSIKEELHIGVIGTINFHKGAEVLKSIVGYLDQQQSGKLTVIGRLSQGQINSNRFYQTGAYEPNQLPKLIENSGTNVFLFPSIWPETFSFVTDELIEMDVPVVCFDIGAPSERIKKYRKGKVIPLNSSNLEIIEALKELNNSFLQERKQYIKQKLKNTSLFNPKFYLEKYPDLAQANIDPYFHYILHGASEGRQPSENFDSKFYLESNFDVKSQGLNPLIHYLDFGRAEGRLPKANKIYNLYQENLKIDQNQNIAVLIHGYYTDLIEELLNKTLSIPIRYDILISVVSAEGKNEVNKWKKKNPTVRVKLLLVENRGRDIAPAFIAFGKELSNYDLICKIHTKKSLYTGAEQITWRKQLINNLLGNKRTIENIIYMFQQDKSLGMVYPYSKLLPYWAYSWLSNKPIAMPLQNKLKVPLTTDGFIDYPMGSMFWFRPNALKQLFDDSLSITDFKEEPCGNDGTFAHAIERAFVDIVKFNKFSYAEVNFEDNSYAKNFGTKNLYQYTQKSIAELTEKIKQFQIISFDIFDTLLTRKVVFPDDLMFQIEQKLDKKFSLKSNFFSLRKKAEHEARVALKKDVSFTEIYSQLKSNSGLKPEIVDYAKSLEFELECQFLKPRENMVEIFNQCLKLKKQVWLVSDMYLEVAQLNTILKQNEIIGYHKIFVSNSLNARKDNGKLWDLLLNENIEEKSKIFHIGDNEHSDIQQTIDRGINNYHVLSGLNIFKNSPVGLNYTNRYTQWQNHKYLGPVLFKLFNSPFVNQAFTQLLPNKFTSAFNSGYAAFGPVVLSFLIWLAEKSKSENISKFYFLAREGYFLKQFYDDFVNTPEVKETYGVLPASEYLLVSRRAVMGAAEKSDEILIDIMENNSFEGILGDFLFNRLGVKLNHDDFPELNQKISLPKQINEVKEKILKFKPQIEAQTETENANFSAYLNSIGYTKEKQPGLVDVGYSGTIQKFLHKIAPQKTKGFYFVTKEVTKTFTSNQNQTFGFFENNADSSSQNPILKFNLYLEFWLTSNEGQLLNFSESNAQILPNFKAKEPAKEHFYINEELSKGCSAFIKDAVSLTSGNLNILGLNSETAPYFFEVAVRQDLWDGDTRKIAFLEDEFCGNEKNLNIIGDYKKFVL